MKKDWQLELLFLMFLALGSLTGYIAGYIAGKGTRQDPMCTLIGAIDPDATCKVLGPSEGKVTFADKTEAYCSLKPKQGLKCDPVNAQPKQQPQQPAPPPAPPADAGVGEGSGSKAPSKASK